MRLGLASAWWEPVALLLLLLLLLLLAATVAAGGRLGGACTHIRLPRGLCTACQMKPFWGRGSRVSFGGASRFDMYDATTPQCTRKLRQYVRLNACDTPRVRAVRTFPRVFRSRLVVARFLYSVCEACCDCIPIGARPSVRQLRRRRRRRSVLNVFRGNCAAHFYYDVCAIWPRAALISGPRGRRRRSSKGGNAASAWCSDFRRWFRSPYSSNWLRKKRVSGLTPNMLRALNQLTERAQCGDSTQWLNCARLEHAQRRI